MEIVLKRLQVEPLDLRETMTDFEVSCLIGNKPSLPRLLIL